MSDIKIEDIKQYLQGKDNTSLLHVRDYKDINPSKRPKPLNTFKPCLSKVKNESNRIRMQ